MTSADTQSLARSPDGPVLLDAYQERPDLCQQDHLARLRQQLFVVLNAALRQGEDVESTVGQIALAYSFLQAKHGPSKVGEYLDPARLPDIVAIGRKLLRVYRDEPIEKLRDRNTLRSGEKVSSLVDDDIGASIFCDDPNRVHCLLPSVREIVAKDQCRSYQSLLQCTESMKYLNAMLDLADQLKINSDTVKCAELGDGQSIESGLRFLKKAVPNDQIGYLEIGVFCRLFASRHGLKQQTPLTLDAKNAKIFLNDLVGPSGSSQDRYNLKPEVLEEYRSLCSELFPDRAEQAFVLLRRYIDSVSDYALMAEGFSRDRLSPECLFPVHRFSAGALGKKKKLVSILDSQ